MNPPHHSSGPSHPGMEQGISLRQHSNGDSSSPYNALDRKIDQTFEEIQPSDTTNGPKKRRACEPCRRLKVPCTYESSATAVCRRCIKTGRICEITARRPRHLTVKSTAAYKLERKIETLTASLEAIKSGASKSPQTSLPTVSVGSIATGESSSSLPQDSSPKLVASRSSPRDPLDIYEKVSVPFGISEIPVPSSQFRCKAPVETPSVVSKVMTQPHEIFRYGILSIEAGCAAYDHFVTSILPHFPIVVIPETLTAMKCVQFKPVLFLAVCNAASGMFPVEIQRELNLKLVRIFAERITMMGEKSLELIQAVQVASVWHCPPRRLKTLRHSQLIHSIGIMAIDMGLNKRQLGNKNETGFVDHTGTPQTQKYTDLSTLECRRAWLGCYFLASQTAQNMRRENLIRWSPWIEDCLQHLETSENALPSDKIFCHWVRLQRLVDGASTSLFIEDPSACKGLDDMSIRFTIKGFDGELDRICANPLERPVTLLLGEINVRLYTHEVALKAGSVDESDIQLPFTQEALKSICPAQAEKLSAAHIASLSTTLKSIHQLFEIFLSMSVTTIHGLPTFQFVRMAYATIVLIRMGIDSTIPNSAIGRMFTIEDFKIDSNLDRLIDLLEAAAEGHCCLNITKFRFVFGVFKSIYWKQVLGKPMPSSTLLSSIRRHNTLHPALRPPYNCSQNSGEMNKSSSATSTHEKSNSLLLLSEAAVAEQQGVGMMPTSSLEPNILMNDVVDFQSIDFNLDSEDFGDLFSEHFTTSSRNPN